MVALATLQLCVAASGASAQMTIDRTVLLAGPAVGLPWTLDVAPAFRFTRAARADGVLLRTTFDASLGLPHWLQVGARYSPESAVVGARPDEWELFGRWAPVSTARGSALDITLQAGFNGAARSPDGELALARWFGPVRLQGAARALRNAYDDEARFGAGAGFVFMPRPRSLPLSIAADAVTLFDRDGDAGERVAWSAGVNVGIPYSTHTVSLFVSSTSSGSLQGTSRGDGRTRLGLTLTAPIAVGQLFGLVVPRQVATSAISTDAPAVEGMRAAEIYRYAYTEYRIEVVRGTTIEWTNRDDVVHTVSADDGSWDSGAIRPRERWRARFEQPGVYPFHCGPHPFMKGTVVVR